ncbi:MAG: SDR family NAD(P)-dependent oxidoreductase [Chloroflexota bacterium]|nr:SDR family NAD(P)-dependent oxidoreductase [Chloroflexota bacterium]
MELTGKVVVISGATGGLGKVTAQAYGAQGAKIALVSSDQTKLNALVQKLALPAGQALVQRADLRDRAAAQAALQAIADTLGPPQILIHLVGGWIGDTDLVETPPDALEAMLEQHVWTTWHLLQAALPLMSTTGWGRVLIVSSPIAVHPQAQNAAYAAAKAAQEALVLTLAQEHSAQGVTANVIQVRAIDIAHQREQGRSPKHADWTLPEEIVAAMLYLCSPEGGRVNGTRLPLFGRGW